MTMKLSSWRDAIPVAKEWSEKQLHESCSCWHVVMDDGNLSDGFILLGLDAALMANHDVCYRLGVALTNMSTTQRGRLVGAEKEWRAENPYTEVMRQVSTNGVQTIFTVPPGQRIPKLG